MTFLRGDLGCAKEHLASELDEGKGTRGHPCPLKEEMIAPFFCHPSDGVFFSDPLDPLLSNWYHHCIILSYFFITTLGVIACLNIFKITRPTM